MRTLGQLAAALTTGVVAAAACLPSGAFECGRDDDCVLGGAAGVCLEGNCAYPEASCGSGLAFPAGSPKAGECVEDPSALPTDGQASQGGSTSPDDDDDDDDDDDADDDDDVDTSGGGEDSTGASATGVPGGSTGEVTCDNPVWVELPVVADTFLSQAEACGGESCVGYGFGGAPSGPLIPGESVYLARFDLSLTEGAAAQVLEAELTLWVAGLGGPGVLLTVDAIDPSLMWGEGASVAEPASVGDATWSTYAFPDGAWPGGTPQGAITVPDLGTASLEMLFSKLPVPLVIPLDAGGAAQALERGGDSLLVSIEGPKPLVSVIARESNEAWVPVLRANVCL